MDIDETDRLDRDCKDCNTPFVITAGEREFYTTNGLKMPRRCRMCRQARRVAQAEYTPGGDDRWFGVR